MFGSRLSRWVLCSFSTSVWVLVTLERVLIEIERLRRCERSSSSVYRSVFYDLLQLSLPLFYEYRKVKGRNLKSSQFYWELCH